MVAAWGEAIYWVATIIAGLIVLWVVWSYVSNAGEGVPIILIVPLLLAGAIWLAGWACRNVFAKR